MHLRYVEARRRSLVGHIAHAYILVCESDAQPKTFPATAACMVCSNPYSDRIIFPGACPVDISRNEVVAIRSITSPVVNRILVGAAE